MGRVILFWERGGGKSVIFYFDVGEDHFLIFSEGAGTISRIPRWCQSFLVNFRGGGGMKKSTRKVSNMVYMMFDVKIYLIKS